MCPRPPPPRRGASAGVGIRGVLLGLADPAHHVAQALPDLLDRVGPLGLAVLLEHRPADLVLDDELLRELAGLDLAEDLPHLVLRLRVHDARAARVVPVLRRVRDGVAHPGEAAFVHEVHDELQLVEALEVGALRLVAGLDEHLEARLHERGRAAAEDRLLAEEIGLRLLLERRLEDAGAAAADPLRVGEAERLRLTRRVLVDGDEAGDAAAVLVLAADEVARALRRDEEDVHVGGGADLVVVDVEAVGEEERLPLRHVRRDLRVVDPLLGLVRDEDHDDIGLLRRVRDGEDAEPRALRLRLLLCPRAQPDAHDDAVVAEVQGVGVALRAVADDRDLPLLEQVEVRILVVVDRRHALLFSHLRFGGANVLKPRSSAMRPERHSSWMPKKRSRSSSASSLPAVPLASTTRASGETSTMVASYVSARARSSA